MKNIFLIFLISMFAFGCAGVQPKPMSDADLMEMAEDSAASKKISAITELDEAPASGDLVVIVDISDGLNKRMTAANFLSDVDDQAIEFMIDGGGAVITTGLKGFIEVPYDCTINSVTVLLDQTGSIAIDVWVEQYVDYPPVDADSITASAVPTVTSALKSQDSTLTGWSKTLTKGDIIGFNIDSVDTTERATISLKVDR